MLNKKKKKKTLLTELRLSNQNIIGSTIGTNNNIDITH